MLGAGMVKDTWDLDWDRRILRSDGGRDWDVESQDGFEAPMSTSPWVGSLLLKQWNYSSLLHLCAPSL